MNWYAYANNRPVVLVDPSGQFSPGLPWDRYRTVKMTIARHCTLRQSEYPYIDSLVYEIAPCIMWAESKDNPKVRKPHDGRIFRGLYQIDLELWCHTCHEWDYLSCDCKRTGSKDVPTDIHKETVEKGSYDR